MKRTISFDDLVEKLTAILVAHRMSETAARVIAGRMAQAQQDGAVSHGLLRLPGYIATLESGWVDGAAVPSAEDAAPGILRVDARNGFAQVAIEFAREPLMRKARENGIAILAVRNSHHFAALWPDVEPFARAGFVAISFVNAKSRMLIWDGDKKLLGTNPLAFACPRKNADPLVFDQASSVVAQGEVLLAAKEGRLVADGIGTDSQGRPTRDPNAILEGGAMRPFGGHKGSSIAFMVEVMAAAITGGQFGYEHDQTGYPAAQTTRAGQCVILIDPNRSAGSSFGARIEALLKQAAASGVSRLPAAHRYARREKSRTAGIPISDDAWELIETLSARAKR
ncbi:MAG: Ldh family oxidoreductase [Variibacter sp.]